jgi:hypothetical protein
MSHSAAGRLPAKQPCAQIPRRMGKWTVVFKHFPDITYIDPSAACRTANEISGFVFRLINLFVVVVLARNYCELGRHSTYTPRLHYRNISQARCVSSRIAVRHTLASNTKPHCAGKWLSRNRIRNQNPGIYDGSIWVVVRPAKRELGTFSPLGAQCTHNYRCSYWLAPQRSLLPPRTRSNTHGPTSSAGAAI